jgi:hypothetical protein
MVSHLRSLEKKKQSDELRKLKRIFLAKPPRSPTKSPSAAKGVSKAAQKDVIQNDFPPLSPQEQTPLGKLIGYLAKKNFKEFLTNFKKTLPVPDDQKAGMISILREWNRQNRPYQERSTVLSVLPSINFSSTSNNAQEKLVIDAIIRGYLKKRNRKAASSIAQFFTALKNFNYFWKDLSEGQKKKTIRLLESIDQTKLITFRDYDEILIGMVHLDMRWNDLTTVGKECLLLSFTKMTENEKLKGSDCHRIIARLNTLRIKFDIDENQVVKQSLMEMIKKELSPHEKIISQLNNLPINFGIDREQGVKQSFIEIIKKALSDSSLDNKEEVEIIVFLFDSIFIYLFIDFLFIKVHE